MLHNAIDVLGATVGLLGLVALWLDPREDTKKRKFLVVALAITILVEGAFLFNDWRQERGQASEDAAVLAAKEEQLMQSLCARDLNYEEIYTSGSMGWSDEVLNRAIDDLMQTRHSVTVKMKYFSLPAEVDRPIPVRFFHLEDRSNCPAVSAHP